MTKTEETEVEKLRQGMYKDIEKIIFTKRQIAARVAEMGAEITAKYAGRDNGLLLAGILRGSVVFYADLARCVKLPVLMDFMSVSSYVGRESGGEVRVIKDLNEPVEGRDIIIVEDIIDTGLTVAALKKLLIARGPASVAVCSFLDKPSRRKTELKAEFIGFTVPDVFIVGYGMDCDQRYRNIPEICVLKN